MRLTKSSRSWKRSNILLILSRCSSKSEIRWNNNRSCTFHTCNRKLPKMIISTTESNDSNVSFTQGFFPLPALRYEESQWKNVNIWLFLQLFRFTNNCHVIKMWRNFYVKFCFKVLNFDVRWLTWHQMPHFGLAVNCNFMTFYWYLRVSDAWNYVGPYSHCKGQIW